MEIGTLDQRITLQSLTETNNFGEVVKEYTDVQETWAMVISQKGAESFEAARMGSVRTIKVKMRYRSDIETDWRIKWMDELYQVISVDRSKRRDGELWLMCETSEAT